MIVVRQQANALRVKGVIEALHEAYREEWLSHYQYWVGAKLLASPQHGGLGAELLRIAEEELCHAALVAEAVLRIEGEPAMQPPLRYGLSAEDFEWLDRSFPLWIIAQNLEAEQKAIRRYRRLERLTRGVHHDLHELSVRLVGEELAHEADLLSLAGGAGTLTEADAHVAMPVAQLLQRT